MADLSPTYLELDSRPANPVPVLPVPGRRPSPRRSKGYETNVNRILSAIPGLTTDVYEKTVRRYTTTEDVPRSDTLIVLCRRVDTLYPTYPHTPPRSPCPVHSSTLRPVRTRTWKGFPPGLGRVRGICSGRYWGGLAVGVGGRVWTGVGSRGWAGLGPGDQRRFVRCEGHVVYLGRGRHPVLLEVVLTEIKRGRVLVPTPGS